MEPKIPETPRIDGMQQDEEWRLLAEEAAQEKDPNKLMEIIKALTRALDEKERRKVRPQIDHDQRDDRSTTSQNIEISNP
jgi:uncharacterized protein YqgV (UPF0045/DUF77 family)